MGLSRIKFFLGVAFLATYCNGLVDTIVMCSEGLVYEGGNSHERSNILYTDDCGLDILMKKVRDPKKGIFSGFIWKVDEMVWNEKWELTCGYFYGFEPARVISEEEAKAYMIRHGAAEEEAEEIVRRDIEG